MSEPPDKCEQLYLMVNDSMNVMKIGCGNAKDRLQEANKNIGTFMPTSYYFYLVKDGFEPGKHEMTERGIHRILDDIRINKKPTGKGHGVEWFKKDLERAKLLFDGSAGHYIDVNTLNEIAVVDTKEKISFEVFDSYCKTNNISSLFEYHKFKIPENFPSTQELEQNYFGDIEIFKSYEEVRGR
jgi:hypothetical protein